MIVERTTPHVRLLDIVHVVAAANDVPVEALMRRGACPAKKRAQALRFIALCLWFFERPMAPSAILLGAERGLLQQHREKGLREIATRPRARAEFKRIARDVIRRTLRRRGELRA